MRHFGVNQGQGAPRMSNDFLILMRQRCSISKQHVYSIVLSNSSQHWTELQPLCHIKLQIMQMFYSGGKNNDTDYYFNQSNYKIPRERFAQLCNTRTSEWCNFSRFYVIKWNQKEIEQRGLQKKKVCLKINIECAHIYGLWLAAAVSAQKSNALDLSEALLSTLTQIILSP